MPVSPRVRVVVLNYDGGEMTLRCLDSAAPARLAARPPRGRARRQRLDRRHRRPGPSGRTPGRGASSRWPTSASPAAATSASATSAAGVDYVALVNNDAVPEPGWLRPLVDALDADPGLGAASSKIVFADRFWGSRSTRRRSPVTDGRDLGVRLSGLEVDGTAGVGAGPVRRRVLGSRARGSG